MAFIRVLRRATGKQYYYVVKSVRKGNKVTTKVLEYLGESPSRQRLAAAKAYWGVIKKRKGGK